MEFNPPFGAWVKARRKQLDLTQTELAERAHFSLASIRKTEEQSRPPSRALAEAIRPILHVPDEDHDAFIAFARGQDIHLRLNHLPAPLTPMIGRNADLGAINALLTPDDGDRLVTLLGPPGVGKTRLAIAVAHALQPAFADGALFVELGPLFDAANIPAAIASALRQRATSGAQTEEVIAEYLEPRTLLLILDNFEHLLDGGALVSRLLARCPGLHVLITSRALLNLSGERVYDVKPLARLPAIELFTRHASAVKPAFAQTPENASVIGEICRRLDDLPLAIELAAARSRMLTPKALLERLTHQQGAPFDLLTSGPRDAAARQRTLRATIDWSFALLDGVEQRFLQHMAVFAGGCTLEGAAVVCGEGAVASDDDLEASEAIIRSLLDKSLIYESEGLDGSTRYNLLEMIREYALLGLSESGGTDRTQHRMTSYLNVLGDAARPYVPKPDQMQWLKRLVSERDNIFAALAWCRSPLGDDALGLRLAGRVGWVAKWGCLWHAYLPIADTQAWLDSVEDRIQTLPPDIRAITLFGLGDLAHADGDRANAQKLFALAGELAGLTGDRWTAWLALWAESSRLDLHEGNYAAAVTLYERMLADSVSDPLWHALAQCMYGRALAANHEPRRAIALLEASLKVWLEHGVDWTMLSGASTTYYYLAQACAWHDEFETAQAHAERGAMGLARVGWHSYDTTRLAAVAALAAGHPRDFAGIAAGHYGLRPTQVRDKGSSHPVAPGYAIDSARCVLHCVESALLNRRGDLPHQVWPATLGIVAREYLILKDPETAFRLFGAAWAQLDLTTGDAVWDSTRLRLDERRAQALADPDVFEHWRAGERMSLDEALDFLGRRLAVAGR